MRILVTGSRNLKNYELVRDALEEMVGNSCDPGEHVVIVHGACPYGGADEHAQHWAEVAVNASHEPHPADFKSLGRKAGPLRNQEMVDLGADVCLAFPEKNSRGTWDCVRRAKAAGIPVEIYEEVES